MNIEPLSAAITSPDGTRTVFRYCRWGRREVWLLSNLRGQQLRQRLREAGFDKRQTRRFVRRFGEGRA